MKIPWNWVFSYIFSTFVLGTFLIENCYMLCLKYLNAILYQHLLNQNKLGFMQNLFSEITYIMYMIFCYLTFFTFCRLILHIFHCLTLYKSFHLLTSYIFCWQKLIFIQGFYFGKHWTWCYKLFNRCIILLQLSSSNI